MIQSEEELEGEADPGEGVVPGGVVEVLDAKGVVEKEALILRIRAADSLVMKRRMKMMRRARRFPDGFFEAAGWCLPGWRWLLQIDAVVLVALGVQQFHYGDA